MPKAIFFGDIVEENGKTIKQNNMEKQHKYPIRTFVEIKPSKDRECRYDGIRAYVGRHSRDCDGTPLYDLVTDLNSLHWWEDTERDMTDEEYAAETSIDRKKLRFSLEFAFLKNISEDSLVVIREVKLGKDGKYDEEYYDYD